MPKTLLLTKLTNEDNKELTLLSDAIYDIATRQTLDEFIASMMAHKNVFEAFLTGEDDDNGIIDRLSELVAAIKANRDSIEKLVNSSFDNADILKKISEEGGELTFAGKPIKDTTGIAFGTSVANATDFTGKIKIIIQEMRV